MRLRKDATHRSSLTVLASHARDIREVVARKGLYASREWVWHRTKLALHCAWNY